MSMIEGIGDEVLQFFGLLVVTLVGLIAWWSTGIRERPQVRTVLILAHRSPNSLTSPQAPQDERGDSDSNVPTENENAENPDGSSCEREERSIPDSSGEDSNLNPSNTIPDNDLIKEKRLAYFRPSEETLCAGSSTPENIQEQDNISDPTATPDNIRIRLKYLNDDQKLVEGRLQELLGDFKRRHFSGELSADKLVRLIFNGQVLQCDDQTLQGYGLYDNCVVHCLVHAQRSNVNRTSSQPQANTTPPESNLGLLLYTSISIILGFAWFFRYHYSQFFTMTTTAGLVGLTAMFAILIIGLHVPDQDTVPTQ